jgi:Carbohydrate-selective porin, OprB family
MRQAASRVGQRYAPALAVAGATVLAVFLALTHEVVAASHGHTSSVVIPRVNLSEPNQSTDVFQTLTDDLNTWYDQYNTFKTTLQNEYDFQFAMPVQIFGQGGTPKGGPGVAEIVYSPSITWNPFTNTAIGSGSFAFALQGNQFWTGANTSSQQGRMGLLAAPNDWAANGYQFAEIAYTHTLPGNLIAATVGQYTISQFDGSGQTKFINYALAQNATQTYSNAGLGVFVQIMPKGALSVAGGFQDATDITGGTITTQGFSTGKYTYFLNAQWTPNFLSGGSYSILYYNQPSVPLQPTINPSTGLSFSAVQNINTTWGLFLRVNGASGQAIPIAASIASGAFWNNPIGRNPLDQFGFGVAWNQTNRQVAGTPSRGAEWVLESYYNFTVFKALQLTPDIQVYVDPALAPNTSVAAVMSLRVTWNF